MERFRLRHTEQQPRWTGNLVTGELLEGPDDPDVPIAVYEGPLGPGYVAVYQGFTWTRVWGPQLPEAHVEDGPLASRRGDYPDRLRHGLPGMVGDRALAVRRPGGDIGVTRHGRRFLLRLGEDDYTLRVRGLVAGHIDLTRPGGGLLARYHATIVGRLAHRRDRIAGDAGAHETALVVLVAACGYPADCVFTG